MFIGNNNLPKHNCLQNARTLLWFNKNTRKHCWPLRNRIDNGHSDQNSTRLPTWQNVREILMCLRPFRNKGGGHTTRYHLFYGQGYQLLIMTFCFKAKKNHPSKYSGKSKKYWVKLYVEPMMRMCQVKIRRQSMTGNSVNCIFRYIIMSNRSIAASKHSGSKTECYYSAEVVLSFIYMGKGWPHARPNGLGLPSRGRPAISLWGKKGPLYIRGELRRRPMWD